MSRHARALVLALPALLLASCGDDGPDDDVAAAASGPGPATVTGGLSVLPDEGDRQILWGDMARAAELAGVEPPADASDSDAVVDYAQALMGVPLPEDGSMPVGAVPPEASAHERLAQADEIEDELGWSIVHIDQFIEGQTLPETVTVMNGDFDADRLEAALGEPDEDGTWLLGDPEGGHDVDAASPARRLGESLWTAPVDGGLVVTRDTDRTGDVRAALAGDPAGPVMADDPALLALAQALDAEEAYGALLLRGIANQSRFETMPPEARERACAEMLPEGPAASAGGIAEDDGPVMLVVLAHDDAAAAEANAAAVEEIVTEGSSAITGQPWSDRLELDGVEVTGPDDTVVVARLRPVEPANTHLWYRMVFEGDGLTTSC